MNPIFVPYLLYVKVSGVRFQKIKERENRIEERAMGKG